MAGTTFLHAADADAAAVVVEQQLDFPQCGICWEEFDTDLSLLSRGADTDRNKNRKNSSLSLKTVLNHRLPVSCLRCSFSICGLCLHRHHHRYHRSSGAAAAGHGRRGGGSRWLPCPSCRENKAFDTTKPYINRTLCQFTEECRDFCKKITSKRNNELQQEGINDGDAKSNKNRISKDDNDTTRVLLCHVSITPHHHQQRQQQQHRHGGQQQQQQQQQTLAWNQQLRRQIQQLQEQLQEQVRRRLHHQQHQEQWLKLHKEALQDLMERRLRCFSLRRQQERPVGETPPPRLRPVLHDSSVSLSGTEDEDVDDASSSSSSLSVTRAEDLSSSPASPLSLSHLA